MKRNKLSINDEATDIDEEQHNESESMNNHEEQRNNNVHQVRSRRRARINYNCARDRFPYGNGCPELPITPSKNMFYHETFSLCCSKGGIVLPLTQSPP